MKPLSSQQRRVLATAGVRVVGWDAAGRPVVEANVGIPHQVRTWAVKRDGDPTDPRQPVTPTEEARR